MRRSPLVLAAVLFAAPAAAEPGLRLSASAYAAALRESAEAANARMAAAEQELADLPPVARFESFRLEGLAALQEARIEVEEIAERSDDQGMRAAVIAMYSLVERVFSESLPEVFELINKDRVRNADLVRLEALMREIEAAPSEAQAKITRAYLAYAAANGWRTGDAAGANEEAPAESEEPPFSAPGIPPEGSRLNGEFHVSFAIRHRNEALELQSTFSSSAGRLMSAMSADGATIEAARKQELEQVRSVLALAQKLEPWQGDTTLRDGLLECGRRLEAALERPVRAFGKAVSKGFEKQQQVDAANALIGEINQAVNGAMDGYGAADQRFRARWAFDAYEAWQKAKRERAPPPQRREPGEGGDGELPAYPEPAGPPA